MKTGRQFGLLQGVIALAAAATAAIHIWLAFQFPDGVDPIFILNGLGYLGLTALLLLPLGALDPYRNSVRWVLITYTLVTVLAWVFVGVRSPLAYADKLIELLLIACLWLDRRQEQRVKLA